MGKGGCKVFNFKLKDKSSHQSLYWQITIDGKSICQLVVYVLNDWFFISSNNHNYFQPSPPLLSTVPFLAICLPSIRWSFHILFFLFVVQMCSCVCASICCYRISSISDIYFRFISVRLLTATHTPHNNNVII